MHRDDRPYIPETCVWELTLRCNLRCLHCGSGAGAKRADELTVEENLRLAESLIRLGCRYVTFIGGEVFLYRGWEKIARRLDENGVLVNIISNGWLLGDKQIEQIRYAGLTNVGLSLDGLAENHNRIRGRRDSFQRVLRSIDRLNAAGIDVGVITTLMDFNFKDLEPLYQLLIEHDVTAWQIQTATAMGQMRGQQAMILQPTKMAEITHFFKEKSLDARLIMTAGDDIGYYDDNEKYLRNIPGRWGNWRGCQAGLSVIGIDSVGNVRGCESLYDERFIEGNVRTEPLDKIWFRENGFAYNRQFDVSLLQGRCAECDKAEICRGGCRGINYFSTGSPFQNSYCVRIGQNRDG